MKIKGLAAGYRSNANPAALTPLERIIPEAGHQDVLIRGAAAADAAPDIARDIFILRTPADAAEVALVEFPPETDGAFHQVARVGRAGQRAALCMTARIAGQRIAIPIVDAA